MKPARRPPVAAAVALLAGLLIGCAPGSPPASPSVLASPTPSPQPTPGIGEVVPAPGSESAIYAPNPGALVVAIDPGHGGCLDWGVPDPQQRGSAFSEKEMTLAISRELAALLEAEGVTVVLTRSADEALAGDDYPPLDCHGAAWRDVNGDGETGFGEGVGEGVRSRDELQARLDLVNLARADLLLSIHINSITQDGVIFEIAATETFFTDETPWGVAATAPLARDVQDGVVAALGQVDYERQDRGIDAVNLFIVAPPLFETTPERPDPRKQPTRGALMPAVLTEVGSITLPAEHELLLSADGQHTAAEGLLAGLAAWFAGRPLAVRYDALLPGGGAGEPPAAIAGDGPPFWAPSVSGEQLAALPIRLTNTGSQAWPEGLSLAAGWEVSDAPYLRVPPAALSDLGVEVPALGPGESVTVVVDITPPAGAERQLGWITLRGSIGSFADMGSPALQVALSES